MEKLQSILKEMMKDGVEAPLEAELDEELGYELYANPILKSNYRNGTSKKIVRTDSGEVVLIYQEIVKVNSSLK